MSGLDGEVNVSAATLLNTCDLGDRVDGGKGFARDQTNVALLVVVVALLYITTIVYYSYKK